MNAKSVSEVVLALVPDLEAQGYEVFLQPNRPIAPAFLGEFRPDIVARRDNQNVVIEVAQKGDFAEKRLKEIAGLFKGQDGWDFRIVWVDPVNPERTIHVESKKTIEHRIAEAKIVAKEHAGPALLLAWAIFEALGRALVAGEFARPQTPGRLVEVLAGRGIVTPTEADQVRALIVKRNALIHGGLGTEIAAAEVEKFVTILESLTASLP